MNHNFSTAEQYGSLQYATTGKVPIFRSDIMVNLLKEGLKDFEQDDYLLLAGPMILNAYAMNIVAKKHKTFKMLVFDAKDQDYKVRHYVAV